MEKIFISACLLGEKVRYHGGSETITHPILYAWTRDGRIVSMCPEVSAGASVPRLPSEIVGIGGGKAVINREASVQKRDGSNCTEEFLVAARLVLNLVERHNIRVALMKDNSPSCGSGRIYDGSFSGQRIDGQGVTAAALIAVGVKVFAETDIESADQYLRDLERLGV